MWKQGVSCSELNGEKDTAVASFHCNAINVPLQTISWSKCFWILCFVSLPLLKGGSEKRPIGRRHQENGAGKQCCAAVPRPVLSLQITFWIFLWEAGTAVVVNQHTAGCHTQSKGDSGACRLHCLCAPCWEGRAGCLLVEKQGALLQQQVPALFALIVIFPKTSKSWVPFWFCLIVICALENKKLVLCHLRWGAAWAVPSQAHLGLYRHSERDSIRQLQLHAAGWVGTAMDLLSAGLWEDRKQVRGRRIWKKSDAVEDSRGFPWSSAWTSGAVSLRLLTDHISSVSPRGRVLSWGHKRWGGIYSTALRVWRWSDQPRTS